MSIHDQALDFRSRVLRRESAASAAVLQTYADSWLDIQRATQQLLAAIGDTQPTPGQLARLSQYQQLLEALQQAVQAASGVANGVITRAQFEALAAGSADASALILAAMPPEFVPFVQPAPLDALTALAGYTQDGTPLSDLLQQSGNAVAQAMKDELRRAIVAGLDPRETARRLQGLWGQSATRALTTARTELMRSYREASRAQYAANSDVVSEWEWLCARSARTCPACLALDGKRFKLDEPQPAHVNCRCTMIPVVKGWPGSTRQSGSDWLANQDQATQQKVLGDKGYAAYSNGASLDDFVQYRHDRQWGKQALWGVPTAPTGPMRDPNTGRMLDHKDVISTHRARFEAWSKDNPNARGIFDYLETLGRYDPDPNAGKYFASGQRRKDFSNIEDALERLPNLPPHIKETLKNNPAKLSSTTGGGGTAGDGRSFYDPKSGTVNMVPGVPVSVYGHEFAHHMESVIPGLLPRSAAFVNGRATGPEELLSSLTGFSGYQPWEKAYPDSFVDPYVGKVYTNGSGNVYATEVLSVGVESVINSAPLFLKDDPDHFWYTIGTLLGD